MTNKKIITLLCISLALTFVLSTAAFGKARKIEMAGYLGVPNDKVDQSYDGGFSLYVAAWPLVKDYPGNSFQTGLFGTWMHPHYDKEGADAKLFPKDRKKGIWMYTDIEGGLGWWRDTCFATETPKFIMGGVELNFKGWANGPGAGKGRDWDKPKGKYGIAMLSPWVLWPPDGLNLKQGTCGQLWGYGYLPLPLTDPKTKTAGKDVPTGNNCWTLFLNSGNFKGPVCFFTPYFWSRESVLQPDLAGAFLDSRPSGANRALQMETQHIPAAIATDTKGDTYARVAPTSFPNNRDGKSITVHKITSYNKKALWDSVDSWFKGGPAASGKIEPAASTIHKIPGSGWSSWRIDPPKTKGDERIRIAWDSFATPFASDPTSFGFKWDMDKVTKTDTKYGSLITLPQYYKLGKDKKDKQIWVPVKRKDVPMDLGLDDVKFAKPDGPPLGPYETPEGEDTCWKSPGPVSGPHYAYPGDGTKVTYYWYRFADQPAMLNADLTKAEREVVQKRVEKLHRHWTKEKTYLPEPAFGELADIDPALILTPPKGLEIGYVPIVTKQEAND